jgi:hypothetical protein
VLYETGAAKLPEIPEILSRKLAQFLLNKKKFI